MSGFASQIVAFGEWLPDQAALGNTLTAVKNAIPQAASYSSVPGLDVLSDAANSRVFAGTWGVSKGGTYGLFIGTATKLYSLASGALTDVTRTSGGDYAVTNWEFIWWGDRVIAIGTGEVPQAFDLGTDSDFALLPNAPTAVCGAVIGDFIVLGGAASNAALVQWSGFNNSEAWTASASTQSDSQELYGQGNIIKRIVPQGNAGIILCERSIRRIEYVGPPLIFRIDVLEEDRGTLAPNAVAWNGPRIFYYGIDGFYMHLGGVSQPIGTEKVDRFIRGDMDVGRLSEMRAAVDRKNQMCVWTYPSLTTGAYRQICYKWELQRWGVFDADIEAVFDYSSSPVTVEGLDALYADIDTMGSVSIDSEALAGGIVSLAGCNTSHKVVTFTNTGSPLAAELETGELQDQQGRILKCKSIRPLVDASSTIQVAERDNQYDNYNYDSALSADSIGEMDCLTSARYHRFKMNLTAQFRHAQGVEVFYRLGGRR